MSFSKASNESKRKLKAQEPKTQGDCTCFQVSFLCFIIIIILERERERERERKAQEPKNG